MVVLVVLTLHQAQPYYPTAPLTIPQKLHKSCLHKGAVIKANAATTV